MAICSKVGMPVCVFVQLCAVCDGVYMYANVSDVCANLLDMGLCVFLFASLAAVK